MVVSSRDLEVIALGHKLAVGDQISGAKCPFCKAEEKSFSMTRERTALVYKCHRNKCGIEGFVRQEPTGFNSGPEIKGKSIYAGWFRTAAPVVAPHKKWMLDNWGFADGEIRKGEVEFSLQSGRLILPIFNSLGERVGATFRSMSNASPKSMICMTDMNGLSMSFYKGGYFDDTIIVVEDQASAIRASEFCTSVALLGTYLDAVRAREIARQDPVRVIFCLDKDAASKGIEYGQKYGPMMGSYTVVIPPKDLKSMTYEELSEFMWNTCNLGDKQFNRETTFGGRGL